MIRAISRMKPVCVNCLYFIPPKNNYPYDALPSDSVYGKCKKFFDIDLVTGEVTHEYARVCRVDKCGPDGKHFIKN
jgi:hypothetical protein